MPRLTGEPQAAKPVYTDQGVVSALTSGGQHGSVAWNGAVVSYSIGTGRLAPGHAEYDAEHAGYAAMSQAMERGAAEAFELWDEVIAISLVERANDPLANITFNYSAATNGGTYAKYSYYLEGGRADHSMADAEIWLATGWSTHNEDRDLYQGGYGILTYIHEIGHALGLSHPGQYNGSASFAADATHFQDTRAYTVMSYFDAYENGSGTDHVGPNGMRYGATPLLHDILAAQAIYGADMTTRTGATTYGFGSTAGRDAFDFVKNPDPVVAIWDAGGIDMIDVSGWNTDQVVDLNAGAFSSVGHLTHNLAIAYGAVIENATTGGGNDVLVGNAADNVLRGGAGDDRLYGGTGSDTIIGGAGDDQAFGGSGADTFVFTNLRKLSTVADGGSPASVIVSGPEGNDALAEVETLQFADGRIVFDLLSTEATVFRMYRAALQRDPEAMGLNGWVAQLEKGLSVDQMAASFMTSSEFQSLYGALSSEDTVRLLYRNVLGREGEAAGVAAWTDLIDRGLQTREQVLRGFAQSDEHVARTRAVVEQGIWNQDEAAASVARLYHAAFDRLPDAGGLDWWLHAAANGRSLAEIADSFVASPEFGSRYAAGATGEFVELMYRNTLDRASDPGGKAFWVAALDSGRIDRGDALLGFSESAEHQMNTTWMFDDGTLIA